MKKKGLGFFVDCVLFVFVLLHVSYTETDDIGKIILAYYVAY